jgi:hypothetical protein
VTPSPTTYNFGEEIMKKDISKYEWIAIRKSKGCSGNFDVVGFKEYESWSVLAGQTATCFIDSFDTYEEALQEYPEAKSNHCAQPTSFNHLPDAEDCGEWDFDDRDY